MLRFVFAVSSIDALSNVHYTTALQKWLRTIWQCMAALFVWNWPLSRLIWI